MLAVAGCAAAPQDDVSDAAERFHSAYRDQDGAQACAVLAPEALSELEESAERPCAEAILAEDLPYVGEPVRVEVFGTMAKVDYDGESTFLTRFQGGWKVLAAGCAARSGRPYECTIQGG